MVSPGVKRKSMGSGDEEDLPLSARKKPKKMNSKIKKKKRKHEEEDEDYDEPEEVSLFSRPFTRPSPSTVFSRIRSTSGRIV